MKSFSFPVLFPRKQNICQVLVSTISQNEVVYKIHVIRGKKPPKYPYSHNQGLLDQIFSFWSSINKWILDEAREKHQANMSINPTKGRRIIILILSIKFGLNQLSRMQLNYSSSQDKWRQGRTRPCSLKQCNSLAQWKEMCLQHSVCGGYYEEQRQWKWRGENAMGTCEAATRIQISVDHKLAKVWFCTEAELNNKV